MTNEPTQQMASGEGEPRTWLPPVLTGVALKAIREGLSVNTDWLGDYLSVSGRQVRNWEAGRYAIPPAVRNELDELQRVTDQAVADHITHATDQNNAAPTLVTYSDDADYHAAVEQQPFPHVRMPASWHRGIVYRAATQLPGAYIVDATPTDPIAAANIPHIGRARLRAVLTELEPLPPAELAALVEFIRGIALDPVWNATPQTFLREDLAEADTLPEPLRQSLTTRVAGWGRVQALAVLHAAHHHPDLIPIADDTEGEHSER